MRRLWNNYSLLILTGTLFLTSWAVYAAVHWTHHVKESRASGLPVEAGRFLSEFFSRTFENWQGELFNIFLVVVLFTYFVHKGSHEHETKESLGRIERRIEQLEDRLSERGQDAVHRVGEGELP
jgi:hypothetical protein